MCKYKTKWRIQVVHERRRNHWVVTHLVKELFEFFLVAFWLVGKKLYSAAGLLGLATVATRCSLLLDWATFLLNQAGKNGFAWGRTRVQ